MAPPERYDVVVAGGGSAGVAAAIGAARAGARTALVESAGCLVGAATMRNVLTYCGLYTLAPEPRQAVRGVAEAPLGKLRRLEAVTAPLRHRGVFVVFDPEAVKLVLDELCAEAGVDVLLGVLCYRPWRLSDLFWPLERQNADRAEFLQMKGEKTCLRFKSGNRTIPWSPSSPATEPG